MKAVIGSLVDLPKTLGRSILPLVKKLTLNIWDSIAEDSHKVYLCKETKDYFYVPRYIGVEFLKQNNIDFVDKVSTGSKAFDNAKEIDLRPYQEPWVVEILNKFTAGILDVVAMAGTGKGKTVMSLEVARRLGRTTLVIVDQNFLRDQWVQAAKKFLNLKDSDIGFIQGTDISYRGKTLVIAMVQTLYNKEYPNQLYKYFGTVILDEVHTLGAEQFSKVLSQFPAINRLGVSATPERGDGLQKILDYHLGPTSVVLDSVHDLSVVRYVEYQGVVSWYANISPKTGRYITELANDGQRNAILARVIKYLYDTGRPTLVVSDRIEHLENLMSLCFYLGIPSSIMGLVAGHKNIWKYAKDPTPPRKPYGLHRGAEYTPVKLQQVQKRNSKEYLEYTKNNAHIIFSPYGMFSKGVDVPRLAAGVDCTPRAKAEQVHGRILRPEIGKQVPLWVTIRDVMSYRAEHQFSNRLVEYDKSNAEIVQWHMKKGVKDRELKELKKEVDRNNRELKLARIVIGKDGNSIVEMRSTGRK